ncbi:hypothetical protein ACFLXD_06355, partial [Chloroflexota bacterium]
LTPFILLYFKEELENGGIMDKMPGQESKLSDNLAELKSREKTESIASFLKIMSKNYAIGEVVLNEVLDEFLNH